MTHLIEGRILVVGKIPKYNPELTNSIVAEFMRQKSLRSQKAPRERRGYSCNHWFLNDRVSSYATLVNDEKTQPFIEVYSFPYILGRGTTSVDWGTLPKDLSRDLKLNMVATVQSGSHVSFNDIEYVMEIYNTTRSLLNKFSKQKKELFGSKDALLRILFDNKQEFFTPAGFRRVMDKVCCGV